MGHISKLQKHLVTKFSSKGVSLTKKHDEFTLICSAQNLIDILSLLKTDDIFCFDTLIDVCAVDYLHYGLDQWKTDNASNTGFSRGVIKDMEESSNNFVKNNNIEQRFAVVYHLLSVKNNHRVRVKVFISEDDLVVPSVVSLWQSANWFEREAYDLYGILFQDHPDLRRILTDYGFIGHPLRKDFPLSGNVEMRYDATEQRVIYEAVDIEPRVNMPKVIRHDNTNNNVEREEILL